MTAMLKDDSTRKKFVDDSVDFLKKFEFDGLDLDFECNIIFDIKIVKLLFKLCFKKDPGINSTEFNRFSPPDDKQKFTLLCKVCILSYFKYLITFFLSSY